MRNGSVDRECEEESARIYVMPKLPELSPRAVLRPGGRLLVWLFNIEGTVDLSVAMRWPRFYGASPYMGAAYWIPTFWVPALLVTHYITFVVLWNDWRRAPQPRSAPDRGRE